MLFALSCLVLPCVSLTFPLHFLIREYCSQRPISNRQYLPCIVKYPWQAERATGAQRHRPFCILHSAFLFVFHEPRPSCRPVPLCRCLLGDAVRIFRWGMYERDPQKGPFDHFSLDPGRWTLLPLKSRGWRGTPNIEMQDQPAQNLLHNKQLNCKCMQTKCQISATKGAKKTGIDHRWRI